MCVHALNQARVKLAVIVMATFLASCSDMFSSTAFNGANDPSKANKSQKQGDDTSKTPQSKDPLDGSDTNPNDPQKDGTANLPDVTISTSGGTVITKKCSRDFSIPGRSNLYLAGMPDGTTIAYEASTDRAPQESPVLVEPEVESCLRPGSKIYFAISGQISHGTGGTTDADGRLSYIADHEKKSIYGKSNVTAPLNSMMGVFLGDGNPSTQAAPAALSFATVGEREYQTLSPVVGQIFFIGNGKTSSNLYQKIIVPAGAKRLYLGIMDTFEWNNNSGQLVGAILLEK